eukprot:364938-Chlamydomonas_euryale.AAC.2
MAPMEIELLQTTTSALSVSICRTKATHAGVSLFSNILLQIMRLQTGLSFVPCASSTDKKRHQERIFLAAAFQHNPSLLRAPHLGSGGTPGDVLTT